jgi:hypothetical protein
MRHARGFFERLARSGTAVDIAVVFALMTAIAVFFLEGFGTGVWVSVLGLLIEAANPYRSQIERIRRGKQILNRYDHTPLGI